MLDSSNDGGLPTRRALISGVGVAGVAAALAACGTASNTASDGNGGAGQSTPTDSAAPPAATTPPAKGSGGGDNSLAKTGDIPVGGGKVFPGQKVVVTQPTSGNFKAFTAICTHQGCTVDTVANGTIQCPCHGSMFSVKDGSVQGGPAPAPLASQTITVKSGEIFLG